MNWLNEWEKLFQNAFDNAKEYLKKRYPLEDDGSGVPQFVAVRKVMEQLPCAVKILLLEVDRERYSHLKDDLCPMISYDFNKMNQLSVKYLGRVVPSDKKFMEILQNEFRIKNTEEFVKSFTEDYTIRAYYEEDLSSNIQFVFYDPRNNLEKFVMDFVFLFEYSFIPVIAKGIQVLPDYNKLHEMSPDPILSEAELLTKYVGMDSFVKLENGKSRKFTMEDLQRDVSPIQLIPTVNEHVKRVFDRAKKLYIFGWYVYDFFPVSHHYAVLALESAIKHRYYVNFGRNVIIRNKLGNETRMSVLDHNEIIDFCKRNRKDKWDVRNLEISGEKFEYTMDGLLGWLVKNKVITNWERKRCEINLWFRNHLSHPTFSPTYPASIAFRTIEEVAYLINKMFSSLKSSSSS